MLELQVLGTLDMSGDTDHAQALERYAGDLLPAVARAYSTRWRSGNCRKKR